MPDIHLSVKLSVRSRFQPCISPTRSFLRVIVHLMSHVARHTPHVTRLLTRCSTFVAATLTNGPYVALMLPPAGTSWRAATSWPSWATMWQRCCWDTRALQVCDKLWRAVAEASHVSLFNKTRVVLRVVALAAPTSNRRNRDWALLGATSLFQKCFMHKARAMMPLVCSSCETANASTSASKPPAATTFARLSSISFSINKASAILPLASSS